MTIDVLGFKNLENIETADLFTAIISSRTVNTTSEAKYLYMCHSGNIEVRQ